MRIIKTVAIESQEDLIEFNRVLGKLKELLDGHICVTMSGWWEIDSQRSYAEPIYLPPFENFRYKNIDIDLAEISSHYLSETVNGETYFYAWTTGHPPSTLHICHYEIDPRMSNYERS